MNGISQSMEDAANKEIDDASVFLQKALYVEPLPYAMDLDHIPSDGHEYIHQVRLEHKQYYPDDTKETFQCIPDADCYESNTNSENLTLAQWKRKEAKMFSDKALDIRQRRRELMQQFPAKSMPPVSNEREWCLYCLGSELYKKLYNDHSVSSAEGNDPYMSIVLHLRQDEIMNLLMYMSGWVRAVGMSHSLSIWIYSLLACLNKPLPDRHERFLETFYDDLKRRIRSCSESEKKQLHLISAILYSYFCIKSYKYGPSLDQFKKLV